MAKYAKPKNEIPFRVTANDISRVVPEIDREEVRKTLDAITEDEVNEFRMRFSAYKNESSWLNPNESIEDIMRGMGICNLGEDMTNAYRAILNNIRPKYLGE